MKPEIINQEKIAYEPKKENRFVVEFPDGFNIPKYVVKSATYPKCIFGEMGVEWEPITFRMYDPVAPSTSQALHELILTTDLQPFEVQLKTLGPVGDVVEHWKLIDCKIKCIDFGNTDWAIDTDREITVTIKSKNCQLQF